MQNLADLLSTIEDALADNRIDDARLAIAAYWDGRGPSNGTDATDFRVRALAYRLSLSEIANLVDSNTTNASEDDAPPSSNLAAAINEAVRPLGLQYRNTRHGIMHFTSIRNLPHDLLDVTLDAIVDVLLASTNSLIQEKMATVESVAIRRDS